MPRLWTPAKRTSASEAESILHYLRGLDPEHARHTGLDSGSFDIDDLAVEDHRQGAARASRHPLAQYRNDTWGEMSTSCGLSAWTLTRAL